MQRYVTILEQSVSFMLSKTHVYICMKWYIVPLPGMFCSTEQLQFTELKLTIYVTKLTMLLIVDNHTDNHDREQAYGFGFCIWIILTSLFSTCRLYSDRQKSANGTAIFTTDT